MSKNKKDNRGGKRLGAGRPKITNKIKLKSISIDQITYNFILENSKKNKTSIKNTVNFLVSFYLANQDKKDI